MQSLEFTGVNQGNPQVGSYQVGALKGGLYRSHIAPLPLYEPYVGVPS